jgi:hypothetical protein
VNAPRNDKRNKVLVLDVRTRWSSTRAMLGSSNTRQMVLWRLILTYTERAFKYRAAVDRYARQYDQRLNGR